MIDVELACVQQYMYVINILRAIKQAANIDDG